jgi:antitoxin VapB
MYIPIKQEAIMQEMTAKLFLNGQSQSVRIPKVFQFEGIKEVIIRKKGNGIIIMPKKLSWLSFADIASADGDFMSERSELMDTDRVVF